MKNLDIIKEYQRLVFNFITASQHLTDSQLAYTQAKNEFNQALKELNDFKLVEELEK